MDDTFYLKKNGANFNVRAKNATGTSQRNNLKTLGSVKARQLKKALGVSRL
jgi:hypothetical protein